LSFQGFDEELRRLPGDYVGPGGVLMLFVPEGGEPAGCVAARRWSSDACEMKRLFVRDRFRGMGVGRALVEAVIAWARTAGYKKMLLDTLPSMESAQRLYADFGFRETAPYRFNPVEGARFMALSLGSLKRPAAPRLPSPGSHVS
jgi:GNAT superfamily N-acetyltransferase